MFRLFHISFKHVNCVPIFLCYDLSIQRSKFVLFFLVFVFVLFWLLLLFIFVFAIFFPFFLRRFNRLFLSILWKIANKSEYISSIQRVRLLNPNKHIIVSMKNVAPLIESSITYATKSITFDYTLIPSYKIIFVSVVLMCLYKNRKIIIILLLF